MKLDVPILFFRNLSRKLRFRCSLTRITGILHGSLCTFMIISRSVLLRRIIPVVFYAN